MRLDYGLALLNIVITAPDHITKRNHSIRGNRLADTATVRGIGVSGDGQYEAMVYVGSDSVMEGNEVQNTGYIGIHYDGSRITIQNNLFDGFNLVKSDGGAIYTYSVRHLRKHRMTSAWSVRTSS